MVLPAYSGSLCDGLPKLSTKPIGAPNGINVERVGPGVRDVDVVHGDPEQTGRLLLHQPPRDVHGELVRAGQGARVRLEVIDRKLQDHFQLLQLEFAACKLRRVERGFVVITQQVLVIGARCRTWPQLSRCLGRMTLRAQARTVGAVVALADPVEAVAGRDDPRIGRAADSDPCESTRRRSDVREERRKSY